MDIRRGMIRAFDSGTYLADVQIVGSMATMLSGVPVAKHIGADLLTSGSKCGVLFFDETNPADACVVFIYGEAHPGHITIPQGKEFRPGGDANTAFGEDASGNAYLKDANAGTKILNKLAEVTWGEWTSTSWDGDSFSDEDWTTLDLSTEFGIPAGVKAVLLNVSIRDSGGAGYCFDIRKEAGQSQCFQVWTQRPDRWITQTGWVPCDSNGDFQYKINASDVNTMDIWVRIYGYIL